jgi:hypothetical protein
VADFDGIDFKLFIVGRGPDSHLAICHRLQQIRPIPLEPSGEVGGATA